MFQRFSLIFALILLASSASAGPIKGQVQYTGPVPAPQVTPTGKYAKVCGPEITDQSLLVKNQGVQNVVVWLSGKDAKKNLKGTPGTYTLNQKNCTYDPHVLPMMRESELRILTADPINHNIHTYSFENDPINIMFTPGQEHVQEMEEAEPIKVECDLHSWMKAWIFVTPNPYFALSKPGGAYEIANVPPGQYTLNFWHESLGEMSQEIQVGEGPKEVNIEFPKLAQQVSQKP